MVVDTIIRVVAKEALKEATKTAAKTAAGKAIKNTVINVVKNVPKTVKTVVKVANTAKAIAQPIEKAKEALKSGVTNISDDDVKAALSVFDNVKNVTETIANPEKLLKKEIKDAFKKEKEEKEEKNDDTYSKAPDDMEEEELAKYGTLEYKSIPKNILNDIRKQKSDKRPLKTLIDSGWDYCYKYSYNWFCKNNGYSGDIVDFDEIAE